MSIQPYWHTLKPKKCLICDCSVTSCSNSQLLQISTKMLELGYLCRESSKTLKEWGLEQFTLEGCCSLTLSGCSCIHHLQINPFCPLIYLVSVIHKKSGSGSEDGRDRVDQSIEQSRFNYVGRE